MFDQPQQRDNKRKHDQSSSDHNKRQTFDQDNSSQFVEKTLNEQNYEVESTKLSTELAGGIEDNIRDKLSGKITGINIPQQNDVYNCELNDLRKVLQKRTRTGSEENKPEDSDSKKVRTSSTDYQPPVEIDVEPGSGASPQSSDRQGNRKSQKGEGLFKTYHGVVYQVRWMMIVALESRRCGAISGFKFKTEVGDKDAGKFDDVVWHYKDGQQEKYNFLQAKHKVDADQRITIKDLLSRKQKDPFALEKYFTSYRQKIKKNKKYQNEKNEEQVENLIIVTNIDLDTDFKKSFEKPKSKIPLLEVINDSDIRNKKREYWKIKEGTLPDKEKIEQILEDTYDLIKLARKLGDCVVDNQLISLSEDEFLKPYSKALTENVIDIQANKFCSDFISGKKLSSEQANNLREAFFRKHL